MILWHCSQGWQWPLQPHLGSGLALPPAEPLSQLSTLSSSAEAKGSITALKCLEDSSRGLQVGLNPKSFFYLFLLMHQPSRLGGREGR